MRKTRLPRKLRSARSSTNSRFRRNPEVSPFSPQELSPSAALIRDIQGGTKGLVILPVNPLSVTWASDAYAIQDDAEVYEKQLNQLLEHLNSVIGLDDADAERVRRYSPDQLYPWLVQVSMNEDVLESPYRNVIKRLLEPLLYNIGVRQEPSRFQELNLNFGILGKNLPALAQKGSRFSDEKIRLRVRELNRRVQNAQNPAMRVAASWADQDRSRYSSDDLVMPVGTMLLGEDQVPTYYMVSGTAGVDGRDAFGDTIYPVFDPKSSNFSVPALRGLVLEMVAENMVDVSEGKPAWREGAKLVFGLPSPLVFEERGGEIEVTRVEELLKYLAAGSTEMAKVEISEERAEAAKQRGYNLQELFQATPVPSLRRDLIRVIDGMLAEIRTVQGTRVVRGAADPYSQRILSRPMAKIFAEEDEEVEDQNLDVASAAGEWIKTPNDRKAAEQMFRKYHAVAQTRDALREAKAILEREIREVFGEEDEREVLNQARSAFVQRSLRNLPQEQADAKAQDLNIWIDPSLKVPSYYTTDLRLDPTHPGALLQRGVQALSAKQNALALDLVKKALNSNRASGSVLANLYVLAGLADAPNYEKFMELAQQKDASVLARMTLADLQARMIASDIQTNAIPGFKPSLSVAPQKLRVQIPVSFHVARIMQGPVSYVRVYAEDEEENAAISPLKTDEGEFDYVAALTVLYLELERAELAAQKANSAQLVAHSFLETALAAMRQIVDLLPVQTLGNPVWCSAENYFGSHNRNVPSLLLSLRRKFTPDSRRDKPGIQPWSVYRLLTARNESGPVLTATARSQITSFLDKFQGYVHEPGSIEEGKPDRDLRQLERAAFRADTKAKKSYPTLPVDAADELVLTLYGPLNASMKAWMEHGLEGHPDVAKAENLGDLDGKYAVLWQSEALNRAAVRAILEEQKAFASRKEWPRVDGISPANQDLIPQIVAAIQGKQVLFVSEDPFHLASGKKKSESNVLGTGDIGRSDITTSTGDVRLFYRSRGLLSRDEVLDQLPSMSDDDKEQMLEMMLGAGNDDARTLSWRQGETPMYVYDVRRDVAQIPVVEGLATPRFDPVAALRSWVGMKSGLARYARYVNENYKPKFNKEGKEERIDLPAGFTLIVSGLLSFSSVVRSGLSTSNQGWVRVPGMPKWTTFLDQIKITTNFEAGTESNVPSLPDLFSLTNPLSTSRKTGFYPRPLGVGVGFTIISALAKVGVGAIGERAYLSPAIRDRVTPDKFLGGVETSFDYRMAVRGLEAKAQEAAQEQQAKPNSSQSDNAKTSGRIWRDIIEQQVESRSSSSQTESEVPPAVSEAILSMAYWSVVRPAVEGKLMGSRNSLIAAGRVAAMGLQGVGGRAVKVGSKDARITKAYDPTRGFYATEEQMFSDSLIDNFVKWAREGSVGSAIASKGKAPVELLLRTVKAGRKDGTKGFARFKDRILAGREFSLTLAPDGTFAELPGFDSDAKYFVVYPDQYGVDRVFVLDALNIDWDEAPDSVSFYFKEVEDESNAVVADAMKWDEYPHRREIGEALGREEVPNFAKKVMGRLSRLNPARDENGRRIRKARRPRHNPYEAAAQSRIVDYAGSLASDPNNAKNQTFRSEAQTAMESDAKRGRPLDWEISREVVESYFPTTKPQGGYKAKERLSSGLGQQKDLLYRAGLREVQDLQDQFGLPPFSVGPQDIERMARQLGLSVEEAVKIVQTQAARMEEKRPDTLSASASLCKAYRSRKLLNYELPQGVFDLVIGQKLVGPRGEAAPATMRDAVVIVLSPITAKEGRVMTFRRGDHVDCDMSTSRWRTENITSLMNRAIQSSMYWMVEKKNRSNRSANIVVYQIGQNFAVRAWTRGQPLTIQTVLENFKQAMSQAPGSARIDLTGYDPTSDVRNYNRAAELMPVPKPATPELDVPPPSEVETEVEVVAPSVPVASGPVTAQSAAVATPPRSPRNRRTEEQNEPGVEIIGAAEVVPDGTGKDREEAVNNPRRRRDRRKRRSSRSS